ncbi:ABC transporter permease [Companilactobacillus pabuli]|jgi:putative ABC transport system permease protein|uniref:Iron export ABC transporter permease subunit FetB n=1 Tax=Companilactobacillus pabuli TaxID=2714036 RepID=A0A7L7KY28_9LACO|nr:iron export ABC transporter permease subunit FetB [Companilactobacillus pabuli]AKP02515.1 membrane protein [Companilactobacillus farciminis]AKS50813.1 membrane protein [Companilactobacillus farciminis]MDG5113937.1 iron export ABC transporter permease subunit FetB [Companilactobacillus pabuli]QMT84691.1 iron export ABC transporter permease subunit FetB [Companilactobacillus pabuli]GAQ00633.1 membrane protein [Companilactobacillus farciminis]
MTNLTVSNSTLALGFVLVLVALVIGYVEKLHINKDILIGVVRAIIQLSIVGYILKFVIKADDIWLTGACFIIIVINASWNAGKRGNGIPKAFQSSLLAISVGTVITLGTLVWTGSIKFVPEQIVPVTGMIASNIMVAIGLCYRNMMQTFTDRHQQVLEKLALGADIKMACLDILRDSIRSGMQPTIDSIKTLGLVSLPGMMSGLIFAGVDPVKAIKYQIMVTFMLLASTGLGSIISCYLAYKQFFNERKQLKDELIS